MSIIGTAVKLVVSFLSNIITGVITKWIQLRESYKRGEAEAKNEIHEENAKRKRRADKVMSWPIKKGKALIDSLRNRGDTAP
jgi:hypothetical protein